MKAYKKRAGSGFTLVELLVVIGIIALLIGILLPVLNKARIQAKKVQCLSNLRQLGIFSQLYAGTFNNYILPGGVRRHAAVAPAGTNAEDQWPLLMISLHYIQPQTIVPSASDVPPSVLICPDVPGPQLIGYSATTIGIFNDGIWEKQSSILPTPNGSDPKYPNGIYYATSYFINSSQAGTSKTSSFNVTSEFYVDPTPTDPNALLKYSQIRQPQDHLLICDGWYQEPRNNVNRIRGRHSSKFDLTNVLFVDGHCETVPRKQITSTAGDWTNSNKYNVSAAGKQRPYVRWDQP